MSTASKLLPMFVILLYLIDCSNIPYFGILLIQTFPYLLILLIVLKVHLSNIDEWFIKETPSKNSKLFSLEQ